MKNSFLTLIFIIAFSPLFAQSDTTKTQTTFPDSIIYTCPMHPDVLSDKPGKCPKCGMDLVQKISSSSEPKMDMMMMMCPMHGMVDMNHQHDKEKKGNKMMKGIGIAMGAMMVAMMTVMVIIVGSR